MLPALILSTGVPGDGDALPGEGEGKQRRGGGSAGPSNLDPIASLLFEIENLLSDTELARSDVYKLYS